MECSDRAGNPRYGGRSRPPGSGAADSSSPSRVRKAIARRLPGRGQAVPALEPLFRTVRATHPKADIRTLERAYETAAYLHRDQVRLCGDPYITHPLAVAQILAELGMTTPTLAAALLHDTVEDTEYDLEQLRKDFGDEVAQLVDGVTKLDKVKYGEAAQAETVRKMVVAMARDIRVLVIKLADRLHNMRTLRYMPAAKQEKTARETLEIYAPLAHRLGMNTDQVGARGPRVRDALPEDVRRDRPPRRQAGAEPRVVPRRRDRAGDGGPSGRQDHRHGHRPTQALLLRLPEDDRARAATSPTSTTSSASASWSTRCATATPRSAPCTRSGTRCRAGSRTTSRCPSSTCTSRCTRR